MTNLAGSWAEATWKQVNKFLEAQQKLGAFRRWQKKRQLAKTILKNLLTIFFLYGLLQAKMTAKYESMKKLGIEIGLNLANELLKRGKEAGKDQEFHRTTASVLHTQLRKTKWQESGVLLTKILTKGFIKLEQLINAGQKSQLAGEIGGFAAGICLIEELEKDLPRHLFLVRRKKRAKLSQLREQLFFIKLDFVQFLHTKLRIIMPYNFNLFIQNFNRLFE